MTNRKHNVQKAMMHLEKARMYFGGQQQSGMERMTHDAIIQYSEKLGPAAGRHHPRKGIGPLAPSQPSSFEFDVYATEEQNSTKPHLDEEDIFREGHQAQWTAGFNDRSLIGRFYLDYVIRVDQAGVHTHYIILTFEHDQPWLGYPYIETATWEVDAHSRLPYNQAVIRQDRSDAIAKILWTAQGYGCQHPDCNGGARNVDLYLRQTS